MKRSMVPYFLFLLVWIQFSALTAQPVVHKDHDSSAETARELVKKWMGEQQIPGVQVAVMKGGELLWSEGLGYANLEHQVPLTPRTKMRIGSVSKTLTSAALGLLIEQDKLDPDLPVQQYVPYFPQKKYPLTTRQVAGHTAGIRHYRGDEFLMNKYFATVKEGIAIFEDDTLLFIPGEKYRYSSYGYNLLSAIIEGASGEEFLIYMEQNVFEPLEMEETTAEYNEQIIPFRTSYYAIKDSTVINAPYVDNSYKWAGGGYLSTCEDLVKFGDAFLDESYLMSATIEELWSSQKTSDGKLTGYGMGWRSGESENYGSWYGHSGGSVGGTTQFIMFPEQGLVLAMMANSSNVRYGDIHQQIAEFFMKSNK
ncbi:MAG: serine hydrolase domain-containing protein [Candidatus Cyclobacteriaceae bacterium M2_1C_046]